MSEQITSILKRKLDELAVYGEIGAETRRNAFKEELQFFVLNFIYHQPEYNNWIMYGGSALRIIHGLDRMSVDLDFEVSNAVTEKFLEELQKEIESYFENTYAAGSDFLVVKITNGRGLLLKFNVGKELSFGQSSNQIHVKIDLNHFVAPKTVIERRPINHGQFSFVIKTYNMSSLMASKIAAIFLRGSRGVGEEIFEEKGRDIYDLLWYMNKKAIPDLDYLIAKGIDVKNLRALFDELTLQMNKVSDANLKQDLTPLFTDQRFIENWLKNWHATYLSLFEAYQIRTITALESVGAHQDFNSENFSFTYWYATEEGKPARIVYNISEYWLRYSEGDLPVEIDEKVIALVAGEMKGKLNDRLKQYITFFYEKSEAYLKKTNQVMLGEIINTKLIRMTADNLNQKEQIVLNKSALISCELDDLLK